MGKTRAIPDIAVDKLIDMLKNMDKVIKDFEPYGQRRLTLSEQRKIIDKWDYNDVMNAVNKYGYESVNSLFKKIYQRRS